MERHNREPSRPQRTASFPSAPGLRPWLLVLLLSIFALLFLPSFLSKGLRPAAGGLIKNGWDALNFLLVLFAILCGLLSRNNNSDDSPTASNSQQWLPSPSPKRSIPVQTSRFGDGYPNQIPTFGESVQTTPVHRRMRSSSSYPDLRRDWLPAEERRFYDDMYLDRRLPETRSTMVTPRHTFSQQAVERTPSHSIPEIKQTISETENQSPAGRRLRSSNSYPDLRQEWVPADEWRFSDDIQLHRRQPERGSPEVKTIPVDTFKLQSSTPPSPPPPPPRRRRTTRKLPKTDPEQEPPRTPPPPRAPPPPPPPPPTPPRDPKRHQRKKSVGGAKDLASALAQFYQKKRKKSSSRSKASPDGAASPPAASGGGPPPPPPPPPPPSSVFNKLFTHKKNGSKAKRVHTVPPPPPPPPQIQRSKTQIPQHSSPLPPTSPHSVRRRRDRSSHANSNLKSPPPPPPPPPPPVPSAATSPLSATGEQGRLSCPPSPDVNNKADIFIARFRAGLELEKQNSIRAKEGQAAAAPTDDEEEMVIGTLFDD